jgi:hypothetical protein
MQEKRERPWDRRLRIAGEQPRYEPFAHRNQRSPTAHAMDVSFSIGAMQSESTEQVES